MGEGAGLFSKLLRFRATGLHEVRACPGKYFSDDTLTLMIANIIACFDIRPALDENGAPIPLALNVTPTIIAFVSPFLLPLVTADKCYAVGHLFLSNARSSPGLNITSP